MGVQLKLWSNARQLPWFGAGKTAHLDQEEDKEEAGELHQAQRVAEEPKAHKGQAREPQEAPKGLTRKP